MGEVLLFCCTILLAIIVYFVLNKEKPKYYYLIILTSIMNNSIALFSSMKNDRYRNQLYNRYSANSQNDHNNCNYISLSSYKQDIYRNQIPFDHFMNKTKQNNLNQYQPRYFDSRNTNFNMTKNQDNKNVSLRKEIISRSNPKYSMILNNNISNNHIKVIKAEDFLHNKNRNNNKSTNAKNISTVNINTTVLQNLFATKRKNLDSLSSSDKKDVVRKLDFN